MGEKLFFPLATQERDYCSGGCDEYETTLHGGCFEREIPPTGEEAQGG